ncbi:MULTISPECIES: Ig-like domain-containing protein [unclassified Escherichia]|uniref:Ig-like domain-containing protein n=1 Tax=unclassified Escherichia TaxID=2608889 RepID=UPI0012FFD51D|nr:MULTISPECIES: Ig-like domain-containing protein [unclassified Escherichia]EGO9199281.1 inverse autotransporter adhesin-like protein YeeJ [Escherichia coli]EGO9221256.1 inverse autotransporter adhesin-like protein YeeJ [Escherichia coli]EGO9230840.1 inverse autotransporter adhesin-like protein YeeJ [Escherichia coli]EHL1289943.1 Ig-like domain-containing protein [Escherichia coli]HDV1386226.1 Ig-like domain-containing protein [Escherichia coli]
MATKKRSGEEINDRQILCGMGIKLRRLTAGICLVTQLVFPMTAAAQGVVNAATQQPVPAQIAIANTNTVPYTLGALESAQSVAERFGISLAELRKLNQFRTFARGFDNVRQGDELDVPAQVSEKNLTPSPRNSSDNLEQQIASTSQQIGSLLAEDMNSEQAANMARGWASSQASGAMTDWLSRFGTARITLGVDEDFSLKNSQFDFLHPWYETPDNLFFSQHTLHRTDERTQINNGLGWRHFTPTWMSGINFFFDHDLSRYHSRAGIGAEYWRDYLKLSSNGYLRLTNWRSAPELDNDYEARPANGWDVRAEGWLPAWPHLGGKLVYEQYYGDEVALFDKDDRQSNPHAITAGLNYTPFPLMTFSAEQRQGKQGENDTRFAVDFTWQPGSAMQKQLDPNEVAARRSLAGSRYDLVDRNNNIVLEYRKKELVRLTLTDPVTGKSGEVKSLVSSLQTKYALKGYNVEATALEAAGGKVVTTGKDILVTLPGYRFTSTPETDNTWPIEVTAEDVKGNLSNREQSMVVVQAPALSQKDSSVSLSTQTLSADSHSTATLTFIAHDAAGNPVIGLVLSTCHEGVQDITLSDWKDNGDGSYTQVLTTGAMSGTLTLMPQLNGVDAAKAPAVVNIISVSSSRTHSSIKIDKDRYLSGNPIEVTVELRDENDKPVKEQKQQLNTAVSIDNVKPGVTTDWKETADGVYKATYTAYTKGSGLTAKLLMQNWNEDLHTAGFIIDANPQSAKIATLSASNNGVLANENAANTVSVNVADEGSNPINDHTVTFAVLNGSATSFNNQNTAKTDVNGLATFDLKSSKQEDNTVEVTLENGVKQTLIVSFVGDSSTAQVDLQKSKNEVVADGNDSATMTATVRDAKGNLLNDVKVTFNVNSAEAKLSQTEVNSHDGIATAALTSLKNGDYTVTASVSSGSQASQQVNFIGDQSTAALTLSVPSGDITVTDTAPQQLTATLQDKNGNPLKDKEITFSVPNDVASRFSISNSGKGMTDSNGIAIASLTGTLAGTHMITARLANSNVSDAQPMAFVADKDRAVVVLQTSKAEIIGNGVDETTLTATVKDPFDNVVKNLSVAFRTSPADTQLSLNARNTNENGIAEVTLKGTVLGVHTAEATLPNGNNDTKTVNIAPDASNARLTLNIPAHQVVTNNSDSVQLTATVKDPSNHPVAGIAVNFTMPQDVAANFTLENNGITVTQANGEAHVTLKGKKAGTHTVTATLINNNASDSQPVTFVADKASAQVALQLSKDEITGNGVDNATLTATVKDQFDNEVNNLPVTFSSASSGLTLTPGVSNTNESGIAQTTLAGVAFGEQTVTVSLANNGASDHKTVQFIGDTAAAKIIGLTSVPDSIIAGTPQNSTGSVITATVVDNNSFPVKGVTVSFTSSTNSAEMTNGGQAVTNEQGKATVTYTNTRSSTESGGRPDTVEASLENGSSTLSTSINVNADASTAHITLLQALTDTVSAGNTTDLYVVVNDNYGNCVPQHKVTISVSPSEGVTPSNNAIYTTNSYGHFYASFTATKARVYQVTATLDNGDSMQQTVTYVPNVANAEITLGASKDPVIADNNDLTTLTATVADTEGNAIANTEVTFTLPEDVRANFTLSDGGKAITDTEGKAKVTLKGTKAGAHTVTASMAGGKSEQLVVNFIADTLTAQVNLNVTENNFIANNIGMTILQATVTDGNGNPLANEAVTFTLPADVSASFTLGQGGSAITDINGKAEVTLSGTKSGTYPVTVSVDSYGVSDTRPVTLLADASTAKLADFTASSSSLIASTTEGATLTASVTDAYDNPLEGIKVNFRGLSATLSNTTAETDAQGKAEILVTSTIAGTKIVVANLANAPTDTIMQTLTVKADADSATITSLEMPEGQVMVATPLAVKAHVDDQFGNPVSEQLVTFSAEPSIFNMVISQDTVSTNTLGIAEVTMTPKRYGSYTVQASLANGSSYEKDLVVIDLKLTLTASSPLIGINDPLGSTLTVRLTNPNGTPVNNELVTFSVTPEDATLSSGTMKTNPSGEAQVVLTSNKVGTYTVTASITSGVIIQAQTIVKVTGNQSTAHVVSLSADPSTITANDSDISTLKATVEDGSGNQVEGVNVNFALKSGSATLGSLTAVTDQHGFATTTVKSARTGSVTVSAGTSTGATQTANITLVAGPADASQSVLKNNRSSLKGDYTDSAELHLVLHDISGNPINVSEGMEFVQSDTNVPYVQVSAIDYSNNFSGEYKATVTGGGEGIATLIPVLNGVHQAGLSTTIQFTRAEDKIMSGTVLVNGANLPTTTFPSQGFTGAYYQLNNDNFAPGKTAADYEFSSSASWVDVDATGKVTFKNVGSNWERITATPKTGGPSYIYEIRVKSWWVNAGDAFMIYSLAENFCSSNGYMLPRASLLSQGRSRGIGTLYSEWGDMGHYMNEADFYSDMYWSSSPANSNEQYEISLATGEQSVMAKLGFAHATCYKNI